MSLAEAERAALNALAPQNGMAGAQILIDTVRTNPAAFSQADSPLGDFARALLAAPPPAAASLAIVPFVAAAAAPPPGRSTSSAIDLAPDMISKHKYFNGDRLGPELYPEAPAEHAFSHLRIDHTMSGFTKGSEEEKAVRLIYMHLMYEAKPFPCKKIPDADGGGPFYSTREHNHTPPAESTAHAEVLIYGVTQLSKTPEACVTGWCATFIDGCLVVQGVRNKGGAIAGSTDMAKGYDDLNQFIEKLFVHLVRNGQVNLPESDANKFKIHTRRSSNKEYIEFDAGNHRLTRPQVFIICMNPGQIKHMIATEPSAAQSQQGALAGLIQIMKGETRHPYPPKCNDPYALTGDGVNRSVARMYFILDEDDLNRSNTGNKTEKLQFDCDAATKRKLESGLDKLNADGKASAAAAALLLGAAGPSAAAAADPDDPYNDDDSEDDVVADDGATDVYGSDAAADGLAFRRQMMGDGTTTGIRSVVRGVVALTATPAACGHDVGAAASQVLHQVVKMAHPANYVGYEWTAAPYAQVTIQHAPVPDRKQLNQIAKTVFYNEILKANDWLDANDEPMMPFKRRADGVITVMKKDLSDIPEGGGKSSADICNLVEAAHKKAGRRGDKVLESDGVGIALMIEDMSVKPPAQEGERRALIISNFTRTDQQKHDLAFKILTGQLVFEDGTSLSEACYADLFVIVFDHKRVRIYWRGEPADDDAEVTVRAAHDSHDVLNAIRDGAGLFFKGCLKADARTGTEPNFVDEGELKYFDSSHTDIKEVYTALLLYKHRQLRRGNNIKLKSIVLSGELGGRGIAYKPGGKKDPDGNDIIAAHSGYLTDQFYMFDAVKNRQITQHGEQALQNIGRLCGLTDDYFLNRMQRTPPRLWTSHSCYNVLKIFGLFYEQWARVMQLKQAGEAMKDAVVRCIKADPERFTALHLVYVKPTTDRRWAKKDLWLPLSRLKNHDKMISDFTRSAPRMPHLARDRDFGIRHDPEADRTEQVKKMIDFAKRDDDDEPPRQRARPNHDARLMKWFRAVEKELKTLKEENDAFGSRDYISAKACGDYLTRLYKCIQVNEWIKTIEEISQYCVTTPLFEQRIRSLAATTGESLPKDPHGTAEDIVVAFNFVINTLGINPVNFARTFVRRGAGSSGVRTAAPTV